jgi:branched-chain amino acid transport system ATP-binding protein
LLHAAQAIRDIKKAGLTVLLSEQTMHFAALVSGKAYAIEKGQIGFCEAMDELRNNEDIRRNDLAL